MSKELDEIVTTAQKAIRKMDDYMANMPVEQLDNKSSFISIAGSFDSIIILAQELQKKELQNGSN